MQICWDSLEKIRYNEKTGTFRVGRGTYYEIDSCLNCGESFLGQKHTTLYCSEHCRYSSKEFKELMSRAGKLHSVETIEKMCRDRKGKNVGDKSNWWKGGYHSNNVPMYDTYASKLQPYEQCRRNNNDQNIIEVKCVFCDKWYIPTVKEVRQRIDGINKNDWCKFYCSDICKESCPIYHQVKYPKGHKPYYNRPLQKEWASLVLEQNNNEYICEICGEYGHIAHHIDPVKCNPIESADIDNGIWLCESCHLNIVHQLPGCTFSELRR
jgi:hypothetical protein